jgi:hypothetical protein
MRWPPDGRNPRPGEGVGASGNHFIGSKQSPEYRPTRRIQQVRPRAPFPIYWRPRLAGSALVLAGIGGAS